jgi:glycosyltransferase involved in cell wall biosynthesis
MSVSTSVRGRYTVKRTKENKTVFLVSHNSNLSGAPISLAQLARALPLFGYKPLYLLPKQGPIEPLLQEWGVEYVVLRRGRNIAHFMQLVRQKRPLVIHVNSLVKTWPVLVSRLLQKPVVWHVREYLGEKKLYARLIHMVSSRVILVSREQFSLFDGMPKAVLVPNGIDLSQYGNILPADIVDGIKPHVRTIITYIGAIEPRKGLLVLAQAAELLKNSPWIHFAVVGDAPERHLEYKREVVGFIHSSGLQDRFHFLGWRQDIPQILAGSDALCHPAYREVFPRVILEAMVSRIPVIASNVGGIPEMIESGMNGILFKAGDYRALAKGIVRIDENEGIKIGMGRHGHRKAQNEFSSEIHAEKISHVYSSMVRRSARIFSRFASADSVV